MLENFFDYRVFFWFSPEKQPSSRVSRPHYLIVSQFHSTCDNDHHRVPVCSGCLEVCHMPLNNQHEAILYGNSPVSQIDDISY